MKEGVKGVSCQQPTLNSTELEWCECPSIEGRGNVCLYTGKTFYISYFLHDCIIVITSMPVNMNFKWAEQKSTELKEWERGGRRRQGGIKKKREKREEEKERRREVTSHLPASLSLSLRHLCSTSRRGGAQHSFSLSFFAARKRGLDHRRKGGKGTHFLTGWPTLSSTWRR